VRYRAVDNSEAMVDKCRQTFKSYMPGADATCRQEDIRQFGISDASVVVINFTLQFLPPEDRQAVLTNIYKGMRPGGVLILSEKTRLEDEERNQMRDALYHQFKTANGYSELEISQKRSALEKVMKLDTSETHEERLCKAGFSQPMQWFQCFGFISLMAIRS